MSIQQINNFELALNYLKGELAEGMALAQLALREVDFSRGRMFVWMPSIIDQDTIENFQWSRRLAGDEKQEFCHFVRDFIQGARCAVILQDMENWDFHGDEYERLAAKYDAELYWYIAGAELSAEDVMNLTEMPVLPYPWCGFFYRDAAATGKQKLTKADLKEIVNTLLGVAVRAFDNDSYVLWWSDGSPLPANDLVN